MKQVIHELHRRTLWQVLGIYLAGSWLALQIVDILSDNIGLPSWVFPFALVLLVLGLPVVLATAFVQEGLPGQTVGDRSGPARTPMGAPGPGDFAGDRRAPTAPSPAPARIASPPPPVDASAPSRRVFTWRNAIAGGGLAFLLLVVVTGVFMFMRSQGIGPAGTLVARGVIDERSPILVAEFESNEADAELARSLTEALRIDFAQTRVVRLVDATTVAEALARMELDPATVLTPDVARRMARREGFPAIIAGSFARIPGGFQLTGRIEDADGQILASRRETASDSSAVIPAIDALSEGLRERLGDSYREMRADPPLERVTTGSLPALELYTRALGVLDEGDSESGISLLEEALLVDPEFAMAWRKLGVELRNSRNSMARSHAATTRAYELRERLTQRERLLAEAAYFVEVQVDRPRAIRVYERMLDLDPSDTWALNNVAILYGEEGDDERSLLFTERAFQLDTSVVSLGNLVNEYLFAGRLEAADSSLTLLRRLFPAEQRIGALATALEVNREDLDAAERVAREALAGSSGSARLGGLDALTHVVVARGRLDEGLDLVEEQAREGESLGYPTTDYWLPWTRATASFLMRNNPGEARADLDRMLAETPLETLEPRDRPYLGLADAYAMLGDAERAEAMIEAFKAAVPDAPPARFRDNELTVAANLALNDGRWDDAIDALYQFERLEPGCDCMNYTLGRAHEGAGRPDSALARYERAIDVPGVQRLTGRSMILGPALERIARIHDEQGRPSEAAAYYSRLADLWAGADPEFAARAEAARARAEEIVRARG